MTFLSHSAAHTPQGQHSPPTPELFHSMAPEYSVWFFFHRKVKAFQLDFKHKFLYQLFCLLAEFLSRDL